MDKWDMITGMCCATCMYCSPKKDEKGRCRRHAPSMQGYPVIYLNDDWCGDHKVGTNPHKQAFDERAKEEAMKQPFEAPGMQGVGAEK